MRAGILQCNAGPHSGPYSCQQTYNMKPKQTQLGILLGVLLLGTATGCSMGKGDGWRFTKSWDIRRAVGWKKDELGPIETPTRLVSTWQDTTLNTPGKSSQRGFGGRLLFFKDDSQDAIRVDGQLVVYAYDDSGRQAHETQPTRRYVFPPEQFVRHESESKVGPSYSVWLPWDEVGGQQKNISLIARFEPKKGPLVVGEQTKHLLPGTRMLAAGKTAPAVQPIADIQLAQFTQESKISVAKPQSEVTSIALARKNWEQRLASPQQQRKSLPTEAAAGRDLPGPVR